MPKFEADATWIKRVWSEHTGGGIMVDFVELLDGKVITLTPDLIVLQRDADSFWDNIENENENGVLGMLEIPE